MSSNGLIFILFALSWSFPNLIKTLGGSSVPFSFVFPSLLIFPYIIIVFITRPFIDKKIFSVICLFLLTLLFFIYSFQIDSKEYIIRFAQIFNFTVVYLYARNNFFLEKNSFDPLKILILCQLPSILFGFLEVIYIFYDPNFLKEFLLGVRLITANISDRAFLFESHSIVLHFFEGSLAAYYFTAVGALIFLYFDRSKNYFKNQNTLINITIFLFLICFIFHRSTTFLMIVFIFGFLMTLKTKNIVFLLLFISTCILVILTSGILYKKYIIYSSGSLVTSDLYRFTAILSSIATFINTNGLGSGPGTFSKTFFSSLIDFFNIFNNFNNFKEIIFDSYLIQQTELNILTGTSNRIAMNSPYFVLIGEYGVIFILFIIIFHLHSLKLRYIEDAIELTLVAGLFIGYPLAYPYFWVIFGLLHNRKINKEKAINSGVIINEKKAFTHIK